MCLNVHGTTDRCEERDVTYITFVSHKNDQPFKNCLQISHYAALSPNLGFNYFVNNFFFQLAQVLYLFMKQSLCTLFLSEK